MAIWKVFTAVLLGLALLWQSRPAYALVYLAVILFFIAQIWQEWAAKKLVVSRYTGEQYLFPRDQGQIAVQIENPTRIPFAWISIVDRIPRNLVRGTHLPKSVFSLAPHEIQVISFPLLARERGVYRLGPLEVFAGDFFGIRTRKFQVNSRETIVVYPEIMPLSELALPARLTFGNFQAFQRINPDPTRLAGVRPYQNGDPLRTIHWPASARTQNLQVKQFEHTVTATCMLFLNLYKNDYKVSRFYVDTELAVTTAASLAAYVIERGESCGLVANAFLTEYLPDTTGISHGEGVIQIRARQGTQQLTQILTVLAGVEAQEQKDFLTLLKSAGNQVAGGAILLWVVPCDTPEIMAAARDLVKRGQQVQIFVLEDVLHQQMLHRPAGAPLQVFSVSREGATYL